MFPEFVVAVVMIVVSSILQAVMQKKPETPQPGKLDVPTAEEGGCVPVIFGTILVKDSNVIDYFDSSTTPIYSSGEGGKK